MNLALEFLEFLGVSQARVWIRRARLRTVLLHSTGVVLVLHRSVFLVLYIGVVLVLYRNVVGELLDCSVVVAHGCGGRCRWGRWALGGENLEEGGKEASEESVDCLWRDLLDQVRQRLWRVAKLVTV